MRISAFSRIQTRVCVFDSNCVVSRALWNGGTKNSRGEKNNKKKMGGKKRERKRTSNNSTLAHGDSSKDKDGFERDHCD